MTGDLRGRGRLQRQRSANLLGTAFPADLQVHNLENPQQPQTAVGVLAAATWGTGSTDPLSLTAYLSTANKLLLSKLL